MAYDETKRDATSGLAGLSHVIRGDGELWVRLGFAATLTLLLAVAVLVPLSPWDYRHDTRVAAMVNGVVITEGDVAEHVFAQRSARGLMDDDAWHAWMATEHNAPRDAESVRAQVLETLVEAELLEQAAVEQGIAVSDADVAAEVDASRESFLGAYKGQPAIAQRSDAVSTGDSRNGEGDAQALEPTSEELEKAWADALAASGYNEETYAEATRASLLRSHLTEACADNGEDFENWFEQWRSQQDIQVNEAPGSLAYA